MTPFDPLIANIGPDASLRNPCTPSIQMLVGISTKRLLRLRNSYRKIESPTPLEQKKLVAIRKELRLRSKNRWDRINHPPITDLTGDISTQGAPNISHGENKR